MSFNWGDDTTYTDQYVVEDAARWYKSILSGYNELEYFATSGKSGSSPPFTSIVLPYGLRTVMRFWLG